MTGAGAGATATDGVGRFCFWDEGTTRKAAAARKTKATSRNCFILPPAGLNITGNQLSRCDLRHQPRGLLEPAGFDERMLLPGEDVIRLLEFYLQQLTRSRMQ